MPTESANLTECLFARFVFDRFQVLILGAASLTQGVLSVFDFVNNATTVARIRILYYRVSFRLCQRRFATVVLFRGRRYL